jgi:hypothetical protein
MEKAEFDLEISAQPSYVEVATQSTVTGYITTIVESIAKYAYPQLLKLRVTKV